MKANRVGRWAKTREEVGAPWSREQVDMVLEGMERIKEAHPDGPGGKNLRRAARTLRAERRG